MKSTLLVLGGIFAGVILSFSGGYLSMQYFSGMADEYQSEWLPDFDEQLFKSAAELAAAKTEYTRWIALGDVALWNVDGGSLEKAEQFARESLRIAEKYRRDWNYGNAIHKAHLTLGRIALRNGNIVTAKEELLLAGNTPGSPQLDSFGPNMVLAKELLDKGEREVILEYLELCGEFWDLGQERLLLWKEELSKGAAPNFGANLIY